MFLGGVILGAGFDGIVTPYPGYQEVEKHHYNGAGFLSLVGSPICQEASVCMVAVMVAVSCVVPARPIWKKSSMW